MKGIIYIIIGIVIGLVESALRLRLFGLTVQINLVALVSLILILSGYKKKGISIYFAGALLMDVISPYRMGLYMLSAVLVVMLVDLMNTRSFDTRNTVVSFITLLILLILNNLFQLLFDPIFSLFIVSILLNATIGTIILYFIIRSNYNSSEIKVSENVFVRK